MASSPKTLYEKIWDAHVVERRDDGTCLIYIDRHLVHEVTSPQAFEGLRAAGRTVRRPDLTLAVPDHNLPTTRARRCRGQPAADRRSRERAAARRAASATRAEFGIDYIDAIAPEQGIVHVVGPEQGFTLPGTTLVCGDSHTSAHGALGALAFGIGTSEVEHVLATQTLLLSQSKTMEVRVDGTLGFGVTPKDVILAIIGRIGAAGGTGHVIEYTGEVIRAMSIEGRLTVANMSIEGGARAGPDRARRDDLRLSQGPADGARRARTGTRRSPGGRRCRPMPGARYDKTRRASTPTDIAPSLTWGTSPEDVVPITGVVPDPDSFADPSKRAAAQKSLDYMGLTPGTRDAGRRRRACLHRQLHQQPDRGSARRRRGRRTAATSPTASAALVVPGLGAGQAPGRGRGARPHLHRGRASNGASRAVRCAWR